MLVSDKDESQSRALRQPAEYLFAVGSANDLVALLRGCPHARPHREPLYRTHTPSA